MLQDQLYSVKINVVRIDTILQPNGVVREDALVALNDSNNTHLATHFDIHLLELPSINCSFIRSSRLRTLPLRNSTSPSRRLYDLRMMTKLYKLDPDGDLYLVLRSPKPCFAAWGEAQDYPSSLPDLSALDLVDVLWQPLWRQRSKPCCDNLPSDIIKQPQLSMLRHFEYPSTRTGPT